jgi:C4-dicarboxylate-specific signal transduction histidine kinase
MTAQAKELDQRIVERTTELTAINEELHKEILERPRAQDALRDPDEKFHQLSDNIGNFLDGGRGYQTGDLCKSSV